MPAVAYFRTDSHTPRKPGEVSELAAWQRPAERRALMISVTQHAKANSPALRPAIRPKAEPAISPALPG
jgi:hypothetical protein